MKGYRIDNDAYLESLVTTITQDSTKEVDPVRSIEIDIFSRSMVREDKLRDFLVALVVKTNCSSFQINNYAHTFESVNTTPIIEAIKCNSRVYHFGTMSPKLNKKITEITEARSKQNDDGTTEQSGDGTAGQNDDDTARQNDDDTARQNGDGTAGQNDDDTTKKNDDGTAISTDDDTTEKNDDGTATSFNDLQQGVTEITEACLTKIEYGNTIPSCIDLFGEGENLIDCIIL